MIIRSFLYKLIEKREAKTALLHKWMHSYYIKALLFKMKSLNVLHGFIKSDMIFQMVGLPMQSDSIGDVKRSLPWKRHQ